MNPNELSAATFPKTNLTILQDKSSFCFGIDAVLLADFTRRQIPQEKIKMKQKTLRLVQPFSDSAPTMVLIESRKNARPEIKILPTLVIYKAQGEYSDSVNKIYMNL